MFRVLLRLRKGEQIKYLSHRDFVRAFEFALRRAKVPIAFSEGFNPRPKMSFGNALSVGVTSEDERIQLETSLPCEPSEIKEALNSNLPPGMEVLEAVVVQDGVKSPLTRMNASEYRLVVSRELSAVSDQPSAVSQPHESLDLSVVKAALEDLMASSEIPVIREKEGRRKEIDIKPYLISASAEQVGDGSIAIDVALGAGDSGGAGTKDLVQALKSVLPDLKVLSICRARQFAY